MSRLASIYPTAVAAFLIAAGGAFGLGSGQVQSAAVPGFQFGAAGFYWRSVKADSALAVAALASGAPAAKAGLRGGDKVVALNGKPVAEWEADEIETLLTGVESWDLEVERGEAEGLQLSLAGGDYVPPAVLLSKRLEEGVGYVRLDHMLAGSAAQLQLAIEELKGGGLSGLVLDLRGNSSGSIDEAIALADALLPAGKVLAATGRTQTRREYHSENADLTGGAALVVLVDGNTAGAAEIVAGAIQDWDRGLLVGEATAGRSSVQNKVDVGGAVSLTLTTAAYSLPSGRYIDRRRRADSSLVEQEVETFHTLERGRQVQSHSGLEPDIQVEGRSSSALFEQLRGRGGEQDRFFDYARDQGPLETYDDAAFEAFRAFAGEAGFEYRSSLERRLEQLKERASDEEKERLSDATERLQKDVDKVEQRHWREAAPFLRRYLAFVDLAMHQGLAEALGHGLGDDLQVDRGRGLLVEEGAYGEAFDRERVGQEIVDGDAD